MDLNKRTLHSSPTKEEYGINETKKEISKEKKKVPAAMIVILLIPVLVVGMMIGQFFAGSRSDNTSNKKNSKTSETKAVTPTASAAEELSQDASSGSGSTETKSGYAPEDSDDPLADGVLTVGYDESYPADFELFLIEMICEKEGWKIDYELVPFDQYLSELNNGSIDCYLGGLTPTSERAKKCLFSESYNVGIKCELVSMDAMEDSSVFVFAFDTRITDAAFNESSDTDNRFNQTLVRDDFSGRRRDFDGSEAMAQELIFQFFSEGGNALIIENVSYSVKETIAETAEALGLYCNTEANLYYETWAIAVKSGNDSLKNSIDECLHNLSSELTALAYEEGYYATLNTGS